MEQLVPLPRAARELADRYPDERMHYTTLQRAVQSGRVPAQRRRTHWFLDRRDYPTVARYVRGLASAGAMVVK